MTDTHPKGPTDATCDSFLFSIYMCINSTCFERQACVCVCVCARARAYVCVTERDQVQQITYNK
jgi:hypothetical protein